MPIYRFQRETRSAVSAGGIKWVIWRQKRSPFRLMGFTLSNQVRWMHYREFTSRGAITPLALIGIALRHHVRRRMQKDGSLFGIVLLQQGNNGWISLPSHRPGFGCSAWPSSPHFIHKAGKDLLPKEVLRGGLGPSIPIAASFNSEQGQQPRQAFCC